jgi:PleD family two-component response regulator
MGPGDSAGDVVRLADQCLYKAKHSGRNRIVADTLPANG